MSDVAGPDEGRRDQTIDLPARMMDQFFRRWFLFLIPVVALTFVGVRAMNNVSSGYVSQGTLSASSNPFVETPVVRGGSIGQYESPAAGISRLVNEQLRSDTFARDVAARAGLTSSIDAGLISLDTIRQGVGARPEGENLMTVSATWGDPKTAFLLVDSTIAAYLDLISNTVAVDSQEAITYWTDRKDSAQERADKAQDELAAYVRTLPDLQPGDQRTTDQQLNLNRLDSALTRATAAVDDAQAQIDTAQLNVQQSQSEAGRQFRIVDPPLAPTVPEGTRFKKVTTLAMFTLLGALMAVAALVVVTLTDKSIRSLNQLRAVANVDPVAVVPRTRSIARTRSVGSAA